MTMGATAARPLVSVITVNYNQSAVTCEMLRSLRHVTYPNVEVIVVDNASPSDRPERIREEFPEANLVMSAENLGFAGGNNLGIHQAKGKYLFFLNNDTEVPAGVFEPLIDLLEANPQIGAVSPLIRYYDEPHLLQYAGFTKMSRWTVRNHAVGYRQAEVPGFEVPVQTHSVHGAAMMVPRAVIDRAGMMPEVYFLYYEEHDWGEMIKRAGYRIYCHPGSHILHKESVSTGRESPLVTYYLTRNRLLFARRNFTGMPFVFSILFHAFVSFPKNTLRFLLSGSRAHLRAYLRGIGWHFERDHGTTLNSFAR